MILSRSISAYLVSGFSLPLFCPKQRKVFLFQMYTLIYRLAMRLWPKPSVSLTVEFATPGTIMY